MNQNTHVPHPTSSSIVLFLMLGILQLCGAFGPSGVALAGTNLPDPLTCSVLPGDALGGLLVAPSSPSPIAASITTVVVRNGANFPIANAAVAVSYESGIATCGADALLGFTNDAGEVTFTLGGGGCVIGEQFAGVIRTQGITIRLFSNAKPSIGLSGWLLMENYPQLRYRLSV